MINPPRSVINFLRWFCREDYIDEIEGDLTEVFKKEHENSPRLAKWKFAWHVVKYLRPEFIKLFQHHRQQNSFGMYKNYFKIALRTLMKNRAFSFINISGLAVGIAGFLLIVQYVKYERSYEDFHQNAPNIFRVTLDLYKGSEYVVTDCETNAPLGPMLKEKMPEVVDYVRLMNNDNQEVRIKDQKFFEDQVYMADPSVFKVFSYPVLYGDTEHSLKEPFQAAVTAAIAQKYFGRTDVVGEMITIAGNQYKITTVFDDIPHNTHLKFNFLLSHSTIKTYWKGYSDEAWDTGNNEYTYLLMKPNTDLSAFNEKLKALSISLKDKIGVDIFKAEHVTDIHLYSKKTFEPEANGDAKTVYTLLFVAFFVIAVAFVNYINLSTSKAVERAKEVGIRKVMGSFRSQLVVQFLVESFMITLAAVALAILFIKLGLPFFREISGQPLSGHLFLEKDFWLVVVSLLAITILLSGIYPAAVLSSFEPVKVLKGKFKSSAHGQWLRQGLVIFQFASTAILLIGLGTVNYQMTFLRHQDLGANIDQTLVLHAPSIDLSDSTQNVRFRVFKNELLGQSFVKSVSRSGSMPGMSLHEIGTTNSIYRLGDEKKRNMSYNYYHYAIDADFMPMFDMKLVAGKNFENGSPNRDRVIINEESVKTLGFASAQDAIGQKITYTTRWPFVPATVIGVVKNFHQRSPKEKHIPMIFRCSDDARYFSMKVSMQDPQEAVSRVQAIWNHSFSDHPFNYFFLNERYNQQYSDDVRFGKMMGAFSAVAVFIACLGLFGLSSYTILQRTKEIGIRKVLGSSSLQVVGLLSKDFIKLVVAAEVIAVPVAYFLVEQWLSTFAVRIQIGIWLFAVPIVTILIIASLTVATQTIRAAGTNPMNSLRSE